MSRQNAVEKEILDWRFARWSLMFSGVGLVFPGIGQREDCFEDQDRPLRFPIPQGVRRTFQKRFTTAVRRLLRFNLRWHCLLLQKAAGVRIDVSRAFDRDQVPLVSFGWPYQPRQSGRERSRGMGCP